jgi:hypothetical protein
MILQKALKIERGIDTFVALRAVHEFVETYHDRETITLPFRQGSDHLEITVRQTHDYYLVTTAPAAPLTPSPASFSSSSSPSASPHPSNTEEASDGAGAADASEEEAGQEEHEDTAVSSTGTGNGSTGRRRKGGRSRGSQTSSEEQAEG